MAARRGRQPWNQRLPGSGETRFPKGLARRYARPPRRSRRCWGRTRHGAPDPRGRVELGEAAAHLALANELMAELAAGQARPYGDGTPQSLAAANERSLAGFGERGAEPLAAMIVRHADACVKALEQRPADRGRGHSAGLDEPAGTGLVSAHAHARPRLRSRPRAGPSAHDRPGPGRADPALHAHGDAPGDRPPHGRDERPLRDPAAGRAAGSGDPGRRRPVRRPGATGRPDCTILIEPVTFLLMALGRQGQGGPIARGRISSGAASPGSHPASRPVHRALRNTRPAYRVRSTAGRSVLLKEAQQFRLSAAERAQGRRLGSSMQIPTSRWRRGPPDAAGGPRPWPPRRARRRRHLDGRRLRRRRARRAPRRPDHGAWTGCARHLVLHRRDDRARRPAVLLGARLRRQQGRRRGRRPRNSPATDTRC